MAMAGEAPTKFCVHPSLKSVWQKLWRAQWSVNASLCKSEKWQLLKSLATRLVKQRAS
jgi:hypothetical protein